MNGPKQIEIAIIGSGFGGLCMGARLLQAGQKDFVLFEKSAQFGGTWQVNDYPGAACDIPSHLYSFSFAPSAQWTRSYPRRDELWAYTQKVARDYGVLPHVLTDCAVQDARFDEDSARWHIETSRGIWSARFLVAAVGALNRPSIPALPGLESFAGRRFHSNAWQHDCDLKGKRVAVIGTGASAIQFIPEIAADTAQLDIYQRTPPWILPRPDHAVAPRISRLYGRFPALARLKRLQIYLWHEAQHLAFGTFPFLARVAESQARRFLKHQIPDDSELRDKLTPHYRMGCKRILLQNTYYPTLLRDNVALHTCGIREIRPHGIVGHDGVERAADVIVFGTGFEVQEGFGALPLTGRDGKRLADCAAGGLEAYKGCSVAGFPNFFMITGPNTGLGHNSMIYMIESGVQYVMEALASARHRQIRTMEVRPEVQQRYNAWLQRRLAGKVWSSGCKSWYLNAQGKNTTLWPGFTFTYRRLTSRFDVANYRCT